MSEQLDTIARSLEIAAERAGDITPLVYARVFAQHPEMEPLFWRDRSGQIRGEMLARLLEVIFDFLDADHYGSNLLRTEIVTHEGYGVPRDVFPKFIEALAAIVKETVGSEWTPAMEQSWRRLTAALTQTAAAG